GTRSAAPGTRGGATPAGRRSRRTSSEASARRWRACDVLDVRFEDPRLFERAAASFAIGGVAGGAAGSLPLAAAGSALALLLVMRPEGASVRRWAAVVGCCGAVAVFWQLAPIAGSPAACGAMLGLLLAIVRHDLAA